MITLKVNENKNVKHKNKNIGMFDKRVTSFYVTELLFPVLYKNTGTGYCYLSLP